MYRDLKPENILVSAEQRGHLKFVDFGFAKMLKGVGKTRTNCGTAAYLAPEVLLGKEYDYRIDVWSLGVLITELISG